MAFKLKAGKEGPMNKNFPSVFKKDDDDKKEEVRKIKRRLDSYTPQTQRKPQGQPQPVAAEQSLNKGNNK